MTASTFRPARTDDLQDIVRMLADDPLGSGRERLEEPVLPSYVRAFEAIERDPNNELLVAVDDDDRAIAVLQVTFTPFITRQGGWRASGGSVHPASAGDSWRWPWTVRAGGAATSCS
jgi:hypothetical protein